MGHPTGMGELICTSGWGELLNLHWDPIVLLVVRPAETHYPWKGKCTIERGKKVGSLSDLCHLQYTSLHRTGLLSPASGYGIYIQVKFLKLQHINM